MKAIQKNLLYYVLERYQRGQYIEIIEKQGEDALDSEAVEDILDVLSSLFMEIGLKSNDEPNKIGLDLEDLIDIINDAE
ncbi:hypothetical protein BMT55_03415 [Listeria newyorkensis]|uniref:Uncharacterized protein n=1 Tax=Listeria newyorkensis TaxID=1497681 RepID=A0ABX4XVU4_9LIST|nr:MULTISPECIES: hypothetical protein [Listeria]KGL41317.1 hypothetical protein EP56_12100 [Listeriaceae bacterium FSL A5-0209]KGL44653.1 hypothetical protein EP58_04030 [Listeria newyorkensis]PNP93830.1 hypothetical protein BMT55_03415 [Listeria newyorkensis]RQW67333.1 hypothetical protein DUK53_06130 [Listeria sp. SHR_NRA_18]WAO22452.1 hypothetical protein OTR81_04040 [Listeria newyorkensis]